MKFLPYHGELKLAYWIGKEPFAKKGLRPYVHLGGGVAQIDAKLPVTIVDCSNNKTRPPTDAGYQQCATAPENAPLTWPKSSLSTTPSGRAPQLTLTKGFFLRALFS